MSMMPSSPSSSDNSDTSLDSTTDARKKAYRDLPWTDEPAIFRYGGKMVRDYLNEADLDEPADYEFRALLKNSVTNRVFHTIFSNAMAQSLYLMDMWVVNALRDQRIEKRTGRPYSYLIVKKIEILKGIGRGFLMLYAREGSPSDLTACGERRLRKAVRAVKKHPAMKYVCKALLEIATMYCNSKDGKRRVDRKVADKDADVPKAEIKRRKEEYNKLIDDMQRAVFEGDIDWFKERYGDDLEDSKLVIEGEESEKDFDDDDEDDDMLDDWGMTPCDNCGMCHY